MPVARQNWLLFIDESGKFEDPTSAALVAGVLVQGYDDPQASMRLRRALAAVYPLTAYPPHAAHLNLPASLVAACLLSQSHARESSDERWLRAAAGPAIAALGSSRAPEPIAFLDMIAHHGAGRRLDREEVARCNAWLRRQAPAAYEKLRWEAEKQRDAMIQLLRTLGPDCYGMGPSFAVGAWEPGGTSAGPDDRYLRLLSALLERACQIVGGGAGAPTLWIHVATRDVVVRRVARDMEQRHVQERASAAVHFLPGGTGAPATLPLALRPQVYDLGVHPGVVLADFVANQLGRVLRTSRSWRATADLAQRLVGLAIEARPSWTAEPGKLPTVAVDGPWREAVRVALSGSHVPDVPATELPAWAREQAEAWITAARIAGARRAR